MVKSGEGALQIVTNGNSEIFNLQFQFAYLPKKTKAPLLAAAARSGAPDPSFPLLGGSFRSGGSGGLSRHFRRDCVDLHGRENLLEPVEDFVTIDVLHQAFG